ncbi:MAG: MobC family plasmid mobilization relaxosome protein [Ruminococcus sp.]|uniref:plasmid mobilization protein n=1 Tax=Ruminococcus sp. TaxID=41978 RepID=UPI0025D0723D|nr:plasmid mobilization relaxosome protein MobC [Ruminococcus sp.]MCR5540866.1 MobC family plasmid mobilization relaxosome protein [Ruminococcus sp.]
MKDQVQKSKKKYNRKGQRKEVLFKDDEWDFVKSKAASMNLSTTRYIVKMALSDNFMPQEIFGFAELTRELSKIGANINQLARKANAVNNIYAEDYERMREEYACLCLLLKRKISTLRRTAA